MLHSDWLVLYLGTLLLHALTARVLWLREPPLVVRRAGLAWRCTTPAGSPALYWKQSSWRVHGKLRVCFFYLNNTNGANQANQTNQLEKKYIVQIWVCFDHVIHANNGMANKHFSFVRFVCTFVWFVQEFLKRNAFVCANRVACLACLLGLQKRNTTWVL